VHALDGLRDGFFLDSGASNGTRGSNTLLLESTFGWRGICVEPNAEMYAELTAARSCICVNCCLYDRARDVQFFEAAGVLGGIVDEYDPNLLCQAKTLVASQGGDGRVEAVTKPARTIGSILQEFRAPRVIDYWSLDTEGSELTILQSFPFDQYILRMLSVEHNYAPSREAIRRFLEERGLRRTHVLGIDDVYMLDAGTTERAWRSRAWSRGT
jgi:FkbM family methyltransferase